jgi:hypothetical protein
MTTRTISIWLDNYDDIFSDFDPRAYSERTLSDDFLRELRNVCSETSDNANEFILQLPVGKRNAETETILIKRLHTHIKQNYMRFISLQKRIQKKAAMTLFIGFILMLGASYLSSLNSKNFLLNALLILVEPTGWFLVWYGLDEVFYRTRQNKNDLEFYSLIAKSKISFASIK